MFEVHVRNLLCIVSVEPLLNNTSFVMTRSYGMAQPQIYTIRLLLDRFSVDTTKTRRQDMLRIQLIFKMIGECLTIMARDAWRTGAQEPSASPHKPLWSDSFSARARALSPRPSAYATSLVCATLVDTLYRLRTAVDCRNTPDLPALATACRVNVQWGARSEQRKHSPQRWSVDNGRLLCSNHDNTPVRKSRI